MTAIDDLLARREATHGSFADGAATAQQVKAVLRAGRNWAALSPVQREAVEQIATKLARIVNGDCNHPDHWDDTAGYADRGNPHRQGRHDVKAGEALPAERARHNLDSPKKAP